MVRTFVAALAVASLLFSGSVAVADLVGRALSTDPDLFTSFNQVDPDYDIRGDMFGIRSRGNPDPPDCVGCDGLPFAIADDSLIIFPADRQGIIKDADLDDFFGVVDTVNGEDSDLNTAIWTFDISAVTSGLSVSIDMGAMGDFENGDIDTSTPDAFVFDVSIDGGAFTPIFTSSVDEDGSLTYIMEGVDEFGDPIEVTLDDPLSMNGTELNNDFQTLTDPFGGTGDSLELRFRAVANGGEEAFAFRNVLVEGTTGGGGFEADFNNDGAVDGDDFLAWQTGFGTPSGADKSDGDYDNDEDVDGDDFLGWQAEFGSGPGAGSTAVPEPAAITLLLSLGLAVAACRHRKRHGNDV